MPTGNKRTNFADKRNLPQTRFKDTFFDYLAEEIFETAHRIWGSRRGVFGEAVLQGNGTDRLKVTSLPVECLDGEGHILRLTATDAEQVYFENSNGVTYYVGARHCLVPSVVERNPRTGLLDYDTLIDSLGVVGVPNSVTEVAGTLRLVVDSVLESGVSCAGRKVTVWLAAPKSTEEDVAIERDLVVQWSGGQNVVSTSGLLGQGSGATSAILTDYAVAATGLTVRRNTDLRTEDPFAFLGTVTGAGAGVEPSTFSTADQVDVTSGLNPTLDLAYDGGPDGVGGSGRRIRVDAGAVDLDSQGANPGDIHGAQLRLNRLGDGAWSQVGLEVLCGDVSHVPIATLQPVKSWSEDTVRQSEPATLSGTRTVTFTRSGVDLTSVQNRINPKLHVLLLEDCPQAGLYAIDSFSAAGIEARNLDGGIPGSWPAGTATARVLVPRFVHGGSQPVAGRCDWWAGPLFVLRDGYQAGAGTLRIMPEGNGRIVIYDNSKTGMTSYFEPRELVVIDPSEVGQDLKWPTRFKRSVLIRGGNVSGGTGEESWYERDGLRIYDAGGSPGERETCFPLVYDYGWPEDVPTFHTDPAWAVEAMGAPVRGHFWEDHFMYHPSGWYGYADTPKNYSPTIVGTGDIYALDAAWGNAAAAGCVCVDTGATGGAALYGPRCCLLDSSFDFRWTFRARARIAGSTGFSATLGLTKWGTQNWGWVFRRHQSDGKMHLMYYSGSTTQDYDTGWSPPTTLMIWYEIYVSYNTTYWSAYSKDGSVAYTWSTSHSPLSGVTDAPAPIAAVQYDTVSGSIFLDWWTWFDRRIVHGVHGNSHNQVFP